MARIRKQPRQAMARTLTLQSSGSRLALFLLPILGVSLAAWSWWVWAAGSLVHSDAVQPADVVLIENFDPNYLLFERAADLLRRGLSQRAIVPVQGGGQVANGMVELMSQVARLEKVEKIPIREEEPITLNTVVDIKAYLVAHKVESVLIVTDGFRSQRAFLVYDKILTPARIRFTIVPVFGLKNVQNWRKSWHGIQDVTLEFAKLWYYRLIVLPGL